MLITKTEIQEHRPVSKSVKTTVLNQYVDDAEIHDLLPLLGEKFYFDIVADVSKYVDLLGRFEYEYDDATIVSPGLKKVLAIFVNARYIMHGSQTDTPFGLVEKNYQDGKSVERGSKKERYKLEQQTAFIYWEQVKLYLDRNADDYPLWGTSCTKRRTFRINKITI